MKDVIITTKSGIMIYLKMAIELEVPEKEQRINEIKAEALEEILRWSNGKMDLCLDSFKGYIERVISEYKGL